MDFSMGYNPTPYHISVSVADAASLDEYNPDTEGQMAMIET